tara:strand:- start:3235 stop:3633 length:399 start_codon:yes stop_codon:yes gene_type:complete
MKRLFLILPLLIIGCASEPDWVNINSASWSKALAFTECSKTFLTGTPKCAISYNDTQSGMHSHILDTNLSTLSEGETVTIYFFKGKTKENLQQTKVHQVLEILIKDKVCRLVINPIKYQDMFLTVGDCQSNG